MSTIEVLVFFATSVIFICASVYFVFFQAKRDDITYSVWDYLFRKPPYPKRPYWVIALSRAVLVFTVVAFFTIPMLIVSFLDGYR